MFNLIFARNELMLDEFKTASLLELFWQVLEFNPDQEPDMTTEESKPLLNQVDVSGNPKPGSTSNQGSNVSSPVKKAAPTAAADVIEYRGDGVEIDEEFDNQLKKKMNLFRSIILKYLHEKNPALKFTKEECLRIMAYAGESYFKHLRLYKYVFNNKTASEIKRINFDQDEARNAGSLQQALQISNGRPK